MVSLEQSKPILQIAHHRLEGKLVTLVEPFALLRTTPPAGRTSDDASSPGRTASEDQAEPTSSAEVYAAKNAPPVLTQRDARDASSRPRIDILALIRRKVRFAFLPC